MQRGTSVSLHFIPDKQNDCRGQAFCMNVKEGKRMITLSQGGAYLIGGERIVEDSAQAHAEVESLTGKSVTKEEAKRETMAYRILADHNTSDNMDT